MITSPVTTELPPPANRIAHTLRLELEPGEDRPHLRKIVPRQQEPALLPTQRLVYLGNPLPATVRHRALAGFRDMPRKMKVFRTSIGFHDAYVAAPSRKAALAAWGATRNLFATEAAEEITDPALTAKPLAHPGKVIRVARGSLEDHLGAAEPSPAPAPDASHQPRRSREPSRAALDKAEAALTAFEETAERELAALREREDALARERAAREERLRRKRRSLTAKCDGEQEKFDKRIEAWRTGG